MTLPLLGFGGYIGTAEESTWGTAVTRTAWVTARTRAIKRAIVTLALDHLTGLMTGPYLRESIQAREDVTGSFSFYGDYANKVLAHCLKHGIGSVATTGSGPYTHTFSPAATLPTGLTIESGSVSEYQVFEGCKVASWTFSCEPGVASDLTVNVIGRTSGGFTTPNSSPPTVPGHAYPIHHGHAGLCTIAGNTYRLRKFSITGDNALARVDALGLQATDEPHSTGFRTIIADVELYRTNEVLEGDYTGRTQADCSIAFTDSTRSLTFNLRNAIIIDRTEQLGQVGGQIISLRIQGFYDGSDNFTAVLVNANSSAV